MGGGEWVERVGEWVKEGRVGEWGEEGSVNGEGGELGEEERVGD